MPRLSLLLLALASLVLSGCANYSLVKPERVRIGQLAVSPTIAWNKIDARSTGSRQVWTNASPLLDQLTLWGGVRDGELLDSWEVGAAQKQPFQPFKAGMGPTELRELIEATVARRLEGRDFKLLSSVPASFVGVSGLRFEYTFLLANGVKMSGLAVAATRDGQLHGLNFVAPSLYYFEAYRPEVERIISGGAVAAGAA
jgi:hypothetical protein